MSKPEIVSADLTSEKRLWDVYLASRKIPSSRFNTVAAICFTLVLLIECALATRTTPETLALVRHYSSEFMFTALSTLGLLLAGFTVFATVTQTELSLKMAEMRNSVSGLSWLKHNYFVFMRVFIYFLVFIVFCLLVTAFGNEGAGVSAAVSKFPNPDLVAKVVVNIAYVALFSGMFFLVLQVKSFVFNVYHAVMTSLRWEAEKY